MKNTIKLLGIIALAALIGFSLASCGDGYLPAVPDTLVTVTLSQNGATGGSDPTTKITLTFSVAIEGLEASDISVGGDFDDTEFDAAEEDVDDPKVWTIAVTDAEDGTAVVSIADIPGYIITIADDGEIVIFEGS